MTEPYEGPAGVTFTPAELTTIFVFLLSSNRPDHVAIRNKIKRYLDRRLDQLMP